MVLVLFCKLYSNQGLKLLRIKNRISKMRATKIKKEDLSFSKTSENKIPDTKDNSDFPIVAIGSSAGGLETL